MDKKFKMEDLKVEDLKVETKKSDDFKKVGLRPIKKMVKKLLPDQDIDTAKKDKMIHDIHKSIEEMYEYSKYNSIVCSARGLMRKFKLDYFFNGLYAYI